MNANLLKVSQYFHQQESLSMGGTFNSQTCQYWSKLEVDGILEDWDDVSSPWKHVQTESRREVMRAYF